MHQRQTLIPSSTGLPNQPQQPQQPQQPNRRRFLQRVAAASLLSLASPMLLAAARQPRVLLVSTNVGLVGKNVSGSYLMEIAYPFQVFLDQGYAVDIVTPLGSKAAIYQAGKTPDDLEKIRTSQAYIDKTEKTLSAAQVNPADYAAIYYPGGHGQYFDVANNERIAAIAAAIHQNGGVVGTAGHGTASLVNIKLKDGSYLVANKRMTCFPTWAEKAWMNISEYGALLPFDMEDVLRQRQARLVLATRETSDNLSLILISDDANRLVTGSFARQAKGVAEQMVRLMAAPARSTAAVAAVA